MSARDTDDGERAMNVSTLLGGPAGVRSAVIGNTQGELLEQAGVRPNPENVAAVLAVLGRDLGMAGEALGLGAWTGAVLTSRGGSAVVGRQREAVAILDIERNRSTADAEALLRDSAWSDGLESGDARGADGAPETDSERPQRSPPERLEDLDANPNHGIEALSVGQNVAPTVGLGAEAPTAGQETEAATGRHEIATGAGASEQIDDLEVDFLPDTEVESEHPTPLRPEASPYDARQDAVGNAQERDAAESKAFALPTVPKLRIVSPPALPRSPLGATNGAPSTTIQGAQRLLARAVPARSSDPIASRPLTSQLVPSDANILDDTWDINEVLGSLSLGPAELRRALAQGDVRKAEAIGSDLFESASDGTESPTSDTRRNDREALGALVNGITAALAGDSYGALVHMRDVALPTATAPSVCWATHLWIARAKLAAGWDLEEARADAHAALGIARQLDTEAEALCLSDLAEIEFALGEREAALSYANSARDRFGPSRDELNLAKVRLLEARVLAALGREVESRVAAEQAHIHHESWPPPVLFMAQCALQNDEVAKAEALMQPLLSKSPRPADVARMAQLLAMVREGQMQAHEANEWLSLIQAQPTPETLRALQAVAERFSEHAFLADALGWMLLRAGDYERAAERFDALGHQPDLTPDERSSILLALGCLATVRSRHEKPGVKLRDAVMAAPDELRSGAPPGPSASPPAEQGTSQVAPIEIGSLERKLFAANLPSWPAEPKTSPRANSHGPVFAGSLRLFCLPDLLEFLRTGQRTGTLVCASENGIGAIQLRSGRVTGAIRSGGQDIGEWLKERGYLSEEGLQEALREQERAAPKKLLGTILIERQLASPDTIRQALHAQIVATIRELMNWVDGQFAFDPETATDSPATEPQVELDPQTILLNLFKEMDEAQR